MSKQVKDGRKLGAAAQEALRLRIADFLRNKKGTQAQAADFFQLSLRCVKKIWKRYKEGGRSSLLAKKRGPGKNTARLQEKGVQQIKTLVKKGTPDQYGLPYTLWTAGAVRLLIKKKRR